MYLKVVRALLLVALTAIAVRLWRPAVRPGPTGSVVGALRPYGVWPNDPVGPDPVLDKRVSRVTIRAGRMEDAVRQFGRQAGVQVVWDKDALPVMSGEPIHLEMTDVTVSGGLRRLLDLGLGPPAVGTRDGIVVLGKPGGVVRFYNVRELLGGTAARPAGRPDPYADPIFVGDSRTERLTALIHANVDPPSWRENGGLGELTEWDGILIVRQSPENHRAIVRLLETLRAAGTQSPPASASGTD